MTPDQTRPTVRSLIAIVLSVLFISPLVAAQDAPAAQEDQSPPELAPAERVSLQLTVERNGRVDSATRRKVALDFDAFSGSPEILEILVRGGPVSEGDELIRLDTEKIDRQVEDAQIALKSAIQNLEFSQKEQGILAEATAIQIERAREARTSAEHAFEIFDRFTGERMIRAAELSVKQHEYRLSDQKEELAQLEEMYEESTLASETKEIVLERNRRQIAISEEYLQFARNDLTVVRDYTFPDEKRKVENQLRWTAAELAHTLENTKMAAARKEREVFNTARSADEAQRKLRDLESDREQFVLRAEATGLLTPVTMEPGDKVRNEQVIAEIVDPDDLIVTLNAHPEDLRVLGEGVAISVTFPAFPEVNVPGEVINVALVGTPQGDATVFPVRIGLKEDHPLVRVGLNCRVEAHSTLENVLAVPREAVKAQNGKEICEVWKDGERIEREVVTGARNEKLVQIVSGLEEGDEVVLQKKEEEKGE